jgi:opacity protein-like surface antigen
MGVAAAAFLLGGGIQAAFAEDDYSRPGPYLSAGFSWGKEALNVEDIEGPLTAARREEQAAVSPVGCSAGSFDCNKQAHVDRQDSPGADFRVGYRFNQIFAAELNYQYFDDFKLIYRGVNMRVEEPEFHNERAPDQDIAHITAHNIFANMRAYPLTGVLQPYGLVGIGTVYADAETKDAQVRVRSDEGFDSPNINGGSDSAVAFAGRFGGGLDYYLTSNIVLNLDINWTLTTEMSIDGLPGKVNLNHVPISTSVMYRF